MDKDNIHCVAVLVMLVAVVTLIVMFIYGLDHSAIFSFTLGIGLIATGLNRWVDDLRPSRGEAFITWVLAMSSFYIGFTRI